MTQLSESNQSVITVPVLHLSLAKAMMLLIAIIAATIYGIEVLSIGSWGVDGDIGVYQLQFDRMQNFNNLYTQIDPGFYSLMLLFARLFDFPSFLITCYFLFYCSLIAPMYKISNSAVLAVVFFLVCFVYPSYTSLTTLVLRQGVGFSMLFLLSFYFNSDRRLLSAGKVMIAALFHASFLFYIPVLIAAMFIRQLSTLSISWLIIALLYAADIPMKMTDLLPESIKVFYRVASATETDFIVGFKPLFLILSCLPMLCLVMKSYYLEVKNDRVLMNVYQIFILANGMAMLFSGIPFYDRIMMFSWVLVPLIGVSFSSFLLSKTRV
ncbi:MAG: EpsG family protein [Rheinheimera sp.]